jgi:hypothetical protein
MPSARPAPWSPAARPNGHSAVRAPVILCGVAQLRQTASDQSRHSSTFPSRALIRTRSFKTRSFARRPNEGIHRSAEDAAASIDVFLGVAARERYTFTTRRAAFLQAGPCRFGLHRRNSNRANVRVGSILLQKSFLGDERNSLGPLMRFACGDVRDLIVSHKNDHEPWHRRCRALQR